MLQNQGFLEKIAACPLFHDISENNLKEDFENIHYQVKHYSKGDMIMLAGQKCDRLIIILKGSVKGEMIDYFGKTIKIEDIEAPRPLAVAFLFEIGRAHV